MEDEDKKSIPGLIPDFFHDVIAYFIPGFTFVLLVAIDYFVAFHALPFEAKDSALLTSAIAIFSSYIFGKFFEQVGYLALHHPSWSKKKHKPKWEILFDTEQDFYTATFRTALIAKIKEWFEKTCGKKFIDECREKGKDDYFNLIQFYLRERFPQVALYEKKQNSSIVLTRSLCVIFAINPLLYSAITFLFCEKITDLKISAIAICFCIINFIFSAVFYSRFRLDQKYHAMYIFEAFIATKKLLKSNNSDENSG